MTEVYRTTVIIIVIAIMRLIIICSSTGILKVSVTQLLITDTPSNMCFLEWRLKWAFIGAHSSNCILGNYPSFSQANECFNAHIRAFI